MEIEKHFFDSFVMISIRRLADSPGGKENESDSMLAIVRECFSNGYKQLALQFSSESHCNGWSLGVVTLLSGIINREGGEIVIIEAEPVFREIWDPLITAFGVKVFSSVEEFG